MQSNLQERSDDSVTHTEPWTETRIPTRLIAKSDESRHAQTLERSASRSSIDVGYDDQFKHGGIG
jgi:hypothetical protein